MADEPVPGPSRAPDPGPPRPPNPGPPRPPNPGPPREPNPGPSRTPDPEISTRNSMRIKIDYADLAKLLLRPMQNEEENTEEAGNEALDEDISSTTMPVELNLNTLPEGVLNMLKVNIDYNNLADTVFKVQPYPVSNDANNREDGNGQPENNNVRNQQWETEKRKLDDILDTLKAPAPSAKKMNYERVIKKRIVPNPTPGRINYNASFHDIINQLMQLSETSTDDDLSCTDSETELLKAAFVPRPCCSRDNNEQTNRKKYTTTKATNGTKTKPEPAKRSQEPPKYEPKRYRSSVGTSPIRCADTLTTSQPARPLLSQQAKKVSSAKNYSIQIKDPRVAPSTSGAWPLPISSNTPGQPPVNFKHMSECDKCHSYCDQTREEIRRIEDQMLRRLITTSAHNNFMVICENMIRKSSTKTITYEDMLAVHHDMVDRESKLNTVIKNKHNAIATAEFERTLIDLLSAFNFVDPTFWTETELQDLIQTTLSELQGGNVTSQRESLRLFKRFINAMFELLWIRKQKSNPKEIQKKKN